MDREDWMNFYFRYTERVTVAAGPVSVKSTHLAPLLKKLHNWTLVVISNNREDRFACHSSKKKCE
jgi:hypothetical protein